MSDSSERRSAVRVNVSFPLKFKKISENEVELIRDNYIQHRTGDREKLFSFDQHSLSLNINDRKFDKTDPLLLQFADTISKKMDILIGLLREKDEELSGYGEGICKNISMVGLLLVTSKELKEGDTLELRVDFPTFPPLIVIALAQVKNVSENGEKFYNSLEFSAINRDDQEAIVGYVFKRQRELIRARP